MTIKSKKKILKTVFSIIYVISITIIFIDWYKKSEIHNRFIDIEFSIYKVLPNKNDGNNVLLSTSYCDTVIQFVNKHPIDHSLNIQCNDYSLRKDSVNSAENRRNFIEQVQTIEQKYRNLERKTFYLFFSIMIIGQILLLLSKYFIDKKIKEIDDNSN